MIHDLNVRVRRLLHTLLSYEFGQTSPPEIPGCSSPKKETKIGVMRPDASTLLIEFIARL